MLHPRSRLALISLGILLAGCAPRDPLQRVVTAPTLGRFSAWRAHVGSDYNPATARAIEAALQEIRLNIAGEREVKRQMGERVEGGAAAIDEAVRARVHGRRLREVLQLGWTLRLDRLKEELAGLENAMRKNAQLVTRPDDLESRHHLEGLQERQALRVENYRAEIATAERKLAALAPGTTAPQRLLESSVRPGQNP